MAYSRAVELVTGIEVRGLSIGGLETCIDLPRQKLCFDIGRCPREAVARPTVLFTHAHMDHMGGVAYHAATRALQRMAPPTYVVPRENAEAFADLFAVWRRLDRSELAHTLVPLSPGEEHRLPNGWVARPFRSPHRVPCQGYLLVSTRRKLRPELAGLAQEEVRERVLAGESPTVEVETPEVAFTGDTRIEVLEREPQICRARLLILEATFLDERVSVEECRDKGHVHLDELAQRANLLQNEAVLLTHFSARYTAEEVRRLIATRLPASLASRVTALVAD
jgi:ribonuclease Z